MQNLLSLLTFSEKCVNSCKKWCEGLEKSEKKDWCKGNKCQARKMLKNDALDAKIGFDAAAIDPVKGSEKLKLKTCQTGGKKP